MELEPSNPTLQSQAPSNKIVDSAGPAQQKKKSDGEKKKSDMIIEGNLFF
jgi:hypothetical protein